MREVSGTTWTFQLIIIFILIFACFLTLVLNYSKAYSVKNRMLTIIEKYEGITPESDDILNSYLTKKGYKTIGKCPDGWYGAINLEGNYEQAKENKKYYYCFTEDKTPAGLVYYTIGVFYRFNLPFIGELVTFQVKGVTNNFAGSNNRIEMEG